MFRKNGWWSYLSERGSCLLLCLKTRLRFLRTHASVSNFLNFKNLGLEIESLATISCLALLQKWHKVADVSCFNKLNQEFLYVITPGFLLWERNARGVLYIYHAGRDNFLISYISMNDLLMLWLVKKDHFPRKSATNPHSTKVIVPATM